LPLTRRSTAWTTPAPGRRRRADLSGDFLEPPYTHTATHRLLAGPHAAEEVDRAWSVQTWVSARTPPCFLVQAEDDNVSDPHNTLIMAACRQHQVPVSLYRYASGGHGFALGRAGTPSVEWPERYAAWLAAR
jgi:acetyl esterase/lipase